VVDRAWCRRQYPARVIEVIKTRNRGSGDNDEYQREISKAPAQKPSEFEHFMAVPI